MSRLIQEAETDKEKAKDALQQARVTVATLKTSDPAIQLSKYSVSQVHSEFDRASEEG